MGFERERGWVWISRWVKEWRWRREMTGGVRAEWISAGKGEVAPVVMRTRLIAGGVDGDCEGIVGQRYIG